jgi:hypothetical protein
VLVGAVPPLMLKSAPHGLPTTHADQLNADLLAFIQA